MGRRTGLLLALLGVLVVASGVWAFSVGPRTSSPQRVRDGEPDPLARLVVSHDEAIASADRVCARAGERIRAIPQATDPATAADVREEIERTTGVYTETIEQLGTVTPPLPERRIYYEFLASLSAFSEELDSQTAFRMRYAGGDVTAAEFRAFAARVQQGQRYIDVGTERARRFGLRVCHTFLRAAE